LSAAVFGFIGVVIGSVLTALLNFFLQRAADNRRWAREDAVRSGQWEREYRTRHHHERLSAYRDLLAAVSVEKFGFVDDDETMGYWLMDKRLEESVKVISACHSEVLLLGSSRKVKEASASINEETILLQRKSHLIHDVEPLGDRELGEFINPVLEARSEFLAVAREDLSIESEEG